MTKHSLGMFQVSPILDFDRDPAFDTPYSLVQNKLTKIPSVEIDSSFNPFQQVDLMQTKASKETWESLYSGLNISTNTKSCSIVQKIYCYKHPLWVANN